MSADVKQWLSEGIAAAKSGKDAIARELLSRVVDQDPHNELAWLWLASLVESDDDLRVCLENTLAINPGNQAARARLAMLDSLQASAPPPATESEPAAPHKLAPPSPPEAGPPPPAPPVEPEIEGCPYCGREIGPDVAVCPHCRGRLVIEESKSASAIGRIWFLAASWAGLALAYLVVDALILMALQALTINESLNQNVSLTGYFKSFVVDLAPSPILPPENLFLFLQILVFGEAIVIAWYVTIAVITPSRRPAVLPITSLVVVMGALFMLFQAAAGIHASLIKLAATLAVGVFLFSDISIFAWKRVWYTLGLDRGLKTALDYYNVGLRYRGKGMLANAILHWQRAVDLDPQRLAFRLKLGNLLYQVKRYREAYEHIRAALGEVPVGSPEAEDLRQFLDEIQARLDAKS